MFAVLAALLAMPLFSRAARRNRPSRSRTPPGLLQQSTQTTKALKSAHLEITVTGKIDGPARQEAHR